MSWTNNNTLEFIDLYRSEGILWDPRHPLNRNRGKVSEAWARIQSCLSINCSIVDLKKKKESLMTSFRMHWNRKKENSNYRTTWFAYASMEAFLCEKYECDSTNELEIEFIHDTESYRQTQDNVDPISCRTTTSLDKSNLIVREPKSKPFSKRKSVTNQSVGSATYAKDLNDGNGNQNMDEYDLYGQLLAKKLRKLDEHQRDVAMHEIDNIMFRAKIQGGSTQSRSYSSPASPNSCKMKSPIFIVTQQNQTQYEDENISYEEHT